MEMPGLKPGSGTSTGSGKPSLAARRRLMSLAFETECHVLEGDARQATALLGGDPVGFAEVVDRDDVRMVERGDRPGLALEPRAPLHICRRQSGKNLDRDIASEARVVRPVDFAHPAGPDCLENLVPAETRAR